MKGVVIMKHFEHKSLEQAQHGFSRTSWQIAIDCLIAGSNPVSGFPTARQHA